jgi:hypothetical protein
MLLIIFNLNLSNLYRVRVLWISFHLNSEELSLSAEERSVGHNENDYMNFTCETGYDTAWHLAVGQDCSEAAKLHDYSIGTI